MKVVYFIPARGGSKGLPGKNILLLAGKPVIEWSIRAALQAKTSGDVVVSTDSEEIASIAKKAGANVPFLRPEHLAQDATPTMDVLFHFLDFQKAKGIDYDMVVLLQPTSPLRNSNDIDGAFELLKSSGAQSVVSVAECDHHPLWANELPADFSMKNFLRPEVKGKNRQQLPCYYMLNGAIYLAKTSYLAEQKSFMGDKTVAYIMPKERSVDIDSEVDLIVANHLLTKQQH